MKEIKAFIGHSFAKEDEAVVQAFLESFSELSKMGIGFSWDHAKEAEAKDLAEKVIEKMQDKNLFIGICTKKEMVISHDKLKPTLFSRGRLSGATDNFGWKTSDWIIQEIGLAIGKGVELWLIIEKGLNKPGGLQGNHEFIEFERNAPEKEFNKIWQTIRNLKPKKIDSSTADTLKPEKMAETDMHEEKKGTHWLSPKEDWLRADYTFGIWQAIQLGNKEAEQKISNAFLETKDGQVQENKSSWEAQNEFFRIFHGKEGSLIKLQNMAKSNTQNSAVQKYLALGYKEFHEYFMAGECFEKAGICAVSVEDQLARYSEAVIAYTHAGHTKLTSGLIKKMKELVTKEDRGELTLIETLRDVAKIKDDKDHILGLSEKILELNPSDISERFKIAHKYSNTGMDGLGLFHYLKIPYQQREAGTWNNIGVQYAKLDIASKSVKAYRKSEELGETLAMSNLARKLIDAGFIPEAEQICEKAVQIPDYDKNIGSDIARIKAVQIEEDEKEKNLITEATPIHAFYKDMGSALAKATVSNLKGVWKDKNCDLNLEVFEGTLTATGSYEQGSLANAFMGLKGMGQPPKIDTYLVRYDAVFEGYTAKGTVKIEKEGIAKEPKTLLGGLSANDRDILMIISEDKRTIRIYENKANADNKFYTINQIDN